MEAWLLIGLIGAAVWYWLDSLRSREIAVRRCRQFCADNGVQLLDQSVHTKRIQPARYGGAVTLRRYYAFDFSIDGADRYHGVAVVCGKSLEYLSLLHPNGEIIYGQSLASDALHETR